MKEILLSLQKQNDKLPNTKKQETFLNILNKSTDEVLISKYLAYLLNEKNTTSKILFNILSSLNVSENLLEITKDAQFVNIDTEFAISKSNRLDIFIRYNNFWVIIENKIFAWESKPNQTIEYEKDINKLNVDKVPVFYIYLKPNYNTSIPANKNFHTLYYKNLKDIMRQISINDLTNQNAYFFLQDFIIHMENYLMKYLNLDDDSINFYIENKKSLDNIIKNYNEQCKNVRNLLVEALENKFKGFLVHPTNSYIQVYKQHWENQGSTGIHFELIPLNANYETLIRKEPVRIKFAIHNEKNTKNKYNIQQEKICTISYNFDKTENIMNSIEQIVIQAENIINHYADKIDQEIAEHNLKI